MTPPFDVRPADFLFVPERGFSIASLACCQTRPNEVVVQLRLRTTDLLPCSLDTGARNMAQKKSTREDQAE